MYEDYSITHDEHKILQFNVTDLRTLLFNCFTHLGQWTALEKLPPPKRGCQWEYPVLSLNYTFFGQFSVNY